jgi:hypothetical protein
MMSVGEVEMEERILLTRTEYSVLKEKNEGNQCGWSEVKSRQEEDKIQSMTSQAHFQLTCEATMMED